MLPRVAASELAAHLARVRAQHQRDRAVGAGWVELPTLSPANSRLPALKGPGSGVFPATRGHADRETGQRRHRHLHETVVQHAVRRAVLASAIAKRARATPFATRSQPIFSRTEATSGRCRSHSGTRT